MTIAPFHRSRSRARAFPLRPASAAALAVLLAACGAPPKPVPAAPSAVEGSAPGPAYGQPSPGGYVWSPAMQAARGQLESRLKGSGVAVTRSADNRLWLTLPGDTAFDANRSALRPAARNALDHVVVVTRTIPNADVRVVGHTDARGGAAANNALSLDRAASTRDWLVARGFSPVRVAVAGRGAQDPLASNDTEPGRASNRRVEVLIGERAPGAAGATPPAGR